MYHEPDATLGEKIPVELFNDILFYIGHDYRSGQTGTHGEAKQHVAMCSLVCRYWANECRPYMFSGATIHISSPEHAEAFIKYTTRGCVTLVPVHKLIAGVHVKQGYNAPRSFCHRFHVLQHLLRDTNRSKFQLTLELYGPIPLRSSRQGVHTPHWSLPPPMVTPPSLLPYCDIAVREIHLPSFSHVAKHIRSFAYARKTTFDALTWNDGASNSSIRFRQERFQKGTGVNSVCKASRCTDNLRICLQATSTLTCSLMHMLRTDEREVLMVLVRWFYDSSNPEGTLNRGSLIWRDLNIKSPECKPQISLMLRGLWEIDFTLDNDGIQDPSSTAFAHVVGLRVLFGWDLEKMKEDFELNVDTLLTHLDRFPMPRVIVLSPRSYDDLLWTTKRINHPLISNPESGRRKCVFVFTRTEENLFPEVPRADQDRDWVEIDAGTLSTTGHSWPLGGSRSDDIILSLLRSTAH